MVFKLCHPKEEGLIVRGNQNILMSKFETIIQLAKIGLGIIALIYLATLLVYIHGIYDLLKSMV